MTRWAWTGSRIPTPSATERIRPGFTYDEVITIALDVARIVKPGDEVGQGGCNGVDSIVLRTASLLKRVIPDLRIETFPADGERRWDVTKAPMDVLLRSDVIHWREPGWGYLERDRALVDWADFVRAMPLFDFNWTEHGEIVVPRGSGTAYTANYANSKSKLCAVLPLRSRD